MKEEFDPELDYELSADEKELLTDLPELTELGMVGIPAAIANAVFHATGRRVRGLPITPDKLL